MDKNRVIDKESDVPWKIPKDWEYVKNTAKGYPIILGKKNLGSIGRALPDRRDIILTEDKGFVFNGREVVHSIEDVFGLCKDEEEIFIFRGEQVYNLFFPYVEKIYIIKIHHEFEGDTFFPEMSYEEWNEVFAQKGMKNNKNPYNYYFHVYERKSLLS